MPAPVQASKLLDTRRTIIEEAAPKVSTLLRKGDSPSHDLMSLAIIPHPGIEISSWQINEFEVRSLTFVMAWPLPYPFL
jgi:hypothetical protein